MKCDEERKKKKEDLDNNYNTEDEIVEEETKYLFVAPKERRLRLEVARIHDSLNDGDIKEIVLVKGDSQIADCMTKANAKSDDILQIFQTGLFK